MPAILEKGKGALTHKIGPLPLWGWVVGGAAGVFLLGRMRGGGGGAAAAADMLRIPTMAPGSPSDPYSGGVGSPSQNWMGGSDTQATKGAPPWWDSARADLFTAFASVPRTSNPLGANGESGSNPSSATAGPKPANASVGPQTIATSAPTSSPGQPWYTRLLAPLNKNDGTIPAGAVVTQNSGTTYSLSSAAIGRAPIEQTPYGTQVSERDQYGRIID